MKLSIITINYNNKEGLEKTLASIKGQTYKNFELIVIDGGSTDGSVQTIKKYSEIINYWVSEKDNGIYDAMNKGIVKASGEYLFFLNSGDRLWNSNTLQNVFNLNVNDDLVYGNYLIYNDPTSYKSPDFIKFSDYWFKSVFCHQTVFIKNSLFKKYGLYNTSFKVVADWDFFVRCIFLHRVSYRYVDIDIAETDITGLSSTIEGQKIAREERYLIYKEYFPGFLDDYDELKDYRGQRYVQLTMKVVSIVRTLRKRVK